MTATDYIKTLASVLEATQVTGASGETISLDEGAQQASAEIIEIKNQNKKIMLVGNGGSAAIVSHMQNDLCDSVEVRALVFTEQPFLTAVANDHGYETFYPKATELWADQGDLFIGISSSGKSKNILQSAEICRKKGGRGITFSGFGAENPLRTLGDFNFYVDAKEYGFVETAHMVLGHYLTDRAIALCK